MSADQINDVIDGVSEQGIDLVEKVLLDKALMAILGATTGPWSLILSPFIKLVLRKCGIYEAMRLGKRKFQLVVDIADGHLVLRSMDKALSSGDIDAIKKAYQGY